jgi:cytochrome c-type biogenesis protein CcmH
VRKKRSLFLTLAVIAVLAAIWSFVLLSSPRNQTLDEQVQDVASQLKCPVCQGESVANSPALIAQQMRGVIRQQLQSGKSEQEVISYFVDRYGEQIAWSPPWQGFTLLAWLVPIVLLLGGVLLLFFILRDWHVASRSHAIPEGEAELANIDDAELEHYREQLEQELAAEDPTALQEVELDFQLGNLAETDYRTLRDRYMRRALLAMKSRHDREQELDEAIEEQLRRMREMDETNQSIEHNEHELR